MSGIQEPIAIAAPAKGSWHTLNSPLWPHSRLELTTPLHLLLMVVSLVLGILCYAHGYTFDGGTLVYLTLIVIFSRPYYTRAYKGWAFFLILLALIPVANVIQNKIMEAGQLAHPQQANYLLGRVTAEGDGPFKWTRFIYTGQELPSLDGSVDHLLLSYMFSTCFMMFLHVLPERFKRPRRASQVAFYVFFVAFTGLFAVLPLVFPNQAGNKVDWLWLMTSMSFVYTWLALALSKSYRALVKTPAMLLWMVLMGLILSPSFETLHSCINHDYWYRAEANMTTMYMCNGVAITVNAPFYHMGYAVVFPAFLGLFMDYLRKLAVRDSAFIYTAELGERRRRDERGLLSRHGAGDSRPPARAAGGCSTSSPSSPATGWARCTGCSPAMETSCAGPCPMTRCTSSTTPRA